MTAFLVSIVNVKDPDRYMDYARAANAAAAKHGGTFLLRGVPDEVLEGHPAGNRVVVSQWKSADDARAYYNSEDYAAAKAKRPPDVAEVTIMLFSGV